MPNIQAEKHMLVLQPNSYRCIKLEILEIPITDSLISSTLVQRLDFMLVNTCRQSLLIHPSTFPGTIIYFVINGKSRVTLVFSRIEASLKKS